MHAFVVFAAIFALLAWRHIHAVLLVEQYLIQTTRIGWTLLGLHATALVFFAAYSQIIFSGPRSGLTADLTIFGWALAGCCTFALACIAFIPVSVLGRLLRPGWRIWAYSAGVTLGACGFLYFNRFFWTASITGTYTAVRLMLSAVLPELVADSATQVLGSRTFSVQIAPACSGVEGIGLILAFTMGWLLYHRRACRFPHALALIPISIAAVWLLNTVRIAALILIGNAGAPAIALGGFHSQAGWIGFNAVAIAVLTGGQRLPGIMPGRRISPQERNDNPVVPYLLPFLAILAGSMLAQALSNGSFETLYPLRVIAAAIPLICFSGRYKRLDWRFGWQAIGTGVGVYLVWMAAAPARPSTAVQAGLAALPAWAAYIWLAARVVGGAVTVPIAEELAFRGFLMRRLIAADFETIPGTRWTWISVLGSSILFGLMHGSQWFAGSIAGFLYAVAFLRKGRIGDSIAAHSVTNALIAARVLLTNDFGFW